MQLRNSSRRYGIISISLHWIFAIAVYGMFGLGLWMVTLSYYDGWYHQAPELHKSIGVLLMLGLVFRAIWRHISPPPAPLKTYGKITRVSAVAAHIALYALLFAILISGYLISTADGKPISVFWPVRGSGNAQRCRGSGRYGRRRSPLACLERGDPVRTARARRP